MITVTDNALEFISHSVETGGIEEELGLRIAIKEASDGGYDYGIGFATSHQLLDLLWQGPRLAKGR